MSCHAWITCQLRERTDLNECRETAEINLTLLLHKEVCLLLKQNKNIKIYSIQKTCKIEWHHKVTMYANSMSFFDHSVRYEVRESKTIRAHRRHYKDRCETIYRVALISLLFDDIFITHEQRYHQLTIWQSPQLVLFTVLVVVWNHSVVCIFRTVWITSRLLWLIT